MKHKLDRLKFSNLIKIDKIYLSHKNSYGSTELRYDGYVMRNNYPNYELLTANVISDIGGLSSETISKIRRYSESWWIEVSASSYSVSDTSSVEIELILMKIIN